MTGDGVFTRGLAVLTPCGCPGRSRPGPVTPPPTGDLAASHHLHTTEPGRRSGAPSPSTPGTASPWWRHGQAGCRDCNRAGVRPRRHRRAAATRRESGELGDQCDTCPSASWTHRGTSSASQPDPVPLLPCKRGGSARLPRTQQPRVREPPDRMVSCPLPVFQERPRPDHERCDSRGVRGCNARPRGPGRRSGRRSFGHPASFPLGAPCTLTWGGGWALPSAGFTARPACVACHPTTTIGPEPDHRAGGFSPSASPSHGRPGAPPPSTTPLPLTPHGRARRVECAPPCGGPPGRRRVRELPPGGIRQHHEPEKTTAPRDSPGARPAQHERVPAATFTTTVLPDQLGAARG